MRHNLCRSFHPWCPGVKNRCLSVSVMRVKNLYFIKAKKQCLSGSTRLSVTGHVWWPSLRLLSRCPIQYNLFEGWVLGDEICSKFLSGPVFNVDRSYNPWSIERATTQRLVLEIFLPLKWQLCFQELIARHTTLPHILLRNTAYNISCRDLFGSTIHRPRCARAAS